MTDCHAIRDQLLQGDAQTRSDLSGHFATCPDCRILADAIATIDADCAEAFEPLLDAPLSPPTPKTWRFSMTVPALILAAAASLTVAALPVLGDWSTSASPASSQSDNADAARKAAEAAARQAAQDQDQPGGTTTVRVKDAATKAQAEAAAQKQVQEDRVGNTFTIPWNAISESEWEKRAVRLYQNFMTMGGERTPQLEMEALVEIGRCAEYANLLEAPFYQDLPEGTYNMAYAAAAMVEVKHPGTIDAAELPSDVVDSIRFLAQAFTDNPLKQDPQRLLLRGRP